MLVLQCQHVKMIVLIFTSVVEYLVVISVSKVSFWVANCRKMGSFKNRGALSQFTMHIIHFYLFTNIEDILSYST